MGVFQYITFRVAMTIITSLVFSIIIGRRIIHMLQKQQIGEVVRDLGLEGQLQKKGTPTMGGLIIILSILVPVVLFCKIDNVYVLLMIVTTLWLGAIGFIDDYIKVFKKNKEGMSGRMKIVGQVGLGVIVASTLYFSDGATTESRTETTGLVQTEQVGEHVEKRAPMTSVPFFKNHKFDYKSFGFWAPEQWQDTIGWIAFAILTIFIVTAVSNGANMTDGLDGLATGTSAIIGGALGIFAYVSTHHDFASYLNIMYVPNSAELVVFISAFIGATIGFLWYNSYPAQVFMGDTGSLTIGGVIAVFAILLHIELLIPILCGIFLVEDLSVILQVSYFKYTRKKYGEGRRILLMAPLHHHFQKKGLTEPKLVARFWLVGIILAISTILTLKIR